MLLMAPVLWTGESAAQLSAIIEPDARSIGMGGAFTAVAEGPATVWWNPGALAFARGIEVSPFSLLQLAPRLTDDVWLYSVGECAGLERVGFGVHFSHLSYGESPVTDIEGNPIGTVHPADYTVLVGAGVDLVPILRRSPAASQRIRWGLGTSWKYSHARFQPRTIFHQSDLPVDEGSGWDMDLGSLFILRFPFEPRTRPGTRNWFGIRAGAHWSSIFGRDLQFDTGGTDPLPRAVRVAGGIESAVFATTPEDALLRVLFCIEHEDVLGEHSGLDKTFHYGGEVEISPLRRGVARVGLALRVGVIDNELSAERSTAGFGLRLRPGQMPLHVAFDYAVVQQDEEIGDVHHYYVSFKWRE